VELYEYQNEKTTHSRLNNIFILTFQRHAEPVLGIEILRSSGVQIVT